MKIESQVKGWPDWDSKEIEDAKAREAAEWLIMNNYQNEKDVKEAFYNRQTSDMSDDIINAKHNDEQAIIRVAEAYKKQEKEQGKIKEISQQVKKPLIVNFYAGPGAGKTTASMELTTALKKAGINVEYVQEYAKELVLENKEEILLDQRRVVDEQYSRLNRLRNSVDVIVTDSPVLLGIVYGEDRIDDAYRKQIRSYYDSFNNFDVQIERETVYQTFGRVQTEEEAIAIDGKIKDMLQQQKINCTSYKRGHINDLVKQIKGAISQNGVEAENKEIQNTDLIIEALEGRWIKELEDENYALICSEINERYLVVDKLYDLNSDGSLSQNKLNELYLEVENGIDPLIDSLESALDAFEDVYIEYKKEETPREEALYREYLRGVKEGIGEDFLDVAMSKEAFLKDLRVKEAKEKIAGYVNDKKYEKNTPLNLRNRNQFIIWKYELVKDKEGLPTGRITKVPYNPKTGNRAASNSRNSWADFDTACQAVDKFNAHGVGIMFANGLIGIDIDHCIDAEGNLTEQAQEITTAIDSYTEYSPSGGGLHILCFGKIPDEGNKRDDVEIYSKDRFFTLTGNLFEGQFKKIPKAEVTQENLTAVYDKYVRRQSMIDLNRAIPKAERTFEDDVIVSKCLKSKNGEFFDKMFNHGICDKYKHKDGSPDFSSHDFELCAMLAYYTDDPAQIDRIFRTSMLMRPKWDEFRGNNTYGAVTIQRALHNRKISHYNPQELWLKEQWNSHSGVESLSDAEIIKKACGSKRFKDIFENGSLNYYTTKAGLPSLAKHEAALVLTLSNYTKNYAQIERIARQSKIITADWDAKAEGSSFTRGQKLIVQLMGRTAAGGKGTNSKKEIVME